MIIAPQSLTAKEKRALVPSASLGRQDLSLRLVSAGLPPLGIGRDKLATTFTFPLVEHTAQTIEF